MNKVLVCYFSASGITKRVAKNIAEAVKGDLFEIEPQEAYTEQDLDWNDPQSRTTIEMNDSSARPKIVHKKLHLDPYDTIILGFPIWWYKAPRIINTFLEENHLEGKKVYVFATSGGSGVEGSFLDLKNTYPTIPFISSKRFTGNESMEDCLRWIE